MRASIFWIFLDDPLQDNFELSVFVAYKRYDVWKSVIIFEKRRAFISFIENLNDSGVVIKIIYFHIGCGINKLR